MHTTQPLTLRRNFSWTLLGNVVYAGCQWAMLVVLAKLGTPEMVGQFALVVTAPIVLYHDRYRTRSSLGINSSYIDNNKKLY